MGEKQLGTAQGEGSEPEDVKRAGWTARFRALPGFRAAAVAFVLTVVLGVGSTVAYAVWSQSKPGSITGTTGYNLPVPTVPRCEWGTPNRVEWTAVPGLEPEASYIVTFHARGKTVAYGVTAASKLTSLKPAELDALRDVFGITWTAEYPLTVSLQTAIIPSISNSPTRISNQKILQSSVSSPSLDMRYSTTGWTNFPCGKG